MPKISIALAIYNEEKNLFRCLNSVIGWVGEIVIVDGGSTDKSVEIARQFKARVIKTDNPPIFHINKQRALDACQGEWILQLDADEVVNGRLKGEIIRVINSTHSKDGYYLPRKNYFLGHWLHKGGQFPDYVIRLIKNRRGKFPCQNVHEQIEVNGELGYLQHPLDHYSYASVSDYWKKANTYINLTVFDLRQKKIPKNLTNRLHYGLIKPCLTFFLIFFRHRGFLDGWYGLLFALFSALHYPLIYIRYFL